MNGCLLNSKDILLSSVICNYMDNGFVGLGSTRDTSTRRVEASGVFVAHLKFGCWLVLMNATCTVVIAKVFGA